MGEKSELKKKYILEKAADVFRRKGFRTVTMKDIVDACEISRGGLYLYFSSTEEVFLQVLQMEMEESDDVFSKVISQDSTATDILLLFLREQKREMLLRNKSLSVATYEYQFAKKEQQGTEKETNPLGGRFQEAVQMLQKLVEAGMEQGEFYEVDPEATARNMMYVLEGLKIQAATSGITEKAIDQEFLYLIEGLVAAEDEEELE